MRANDLLDYRPQRSCEGYVFTPVCHSVHGGGGSGSVHVGLPCPPPPEQPPPLPREQTPLPEEGTPTPADGTHPTGMHSCYRYTLTTVDLLNIIKSRFKNDNCRLLTANAAVDVRSLGMCQICIS